MTRNGIGDPIPFLSLRNAGECLLGGLGIFALCMVGQEYYKVSGTLAAPFWPSSGLALALLLLGGWRLFPAILSGTIAATQTFGDNALFSLAGSIANTLESLIGWFLMTRVFGFSTSMTRVRDLLVLMLAGAPWGTMVSAILCTLGLVASGAVKPDGIPLSSLLFWTGNVLGILVFTPLFLRLSQRWKQGNLLGASARDVLWTVILSGVVIVGFGLKNTAHTGLIPLAYLSFPLLVWLSFEWRRDVTLALALVTVLMTAFTATGHGPLLRADPMATYAEMTIFITVYAISCLILMAAVEEGRVSSTLAMEHKLSAVRKEAELRGIRANLNPHFLFNSLNAIKSLVAEDPAKSQKAIVSLSEILRTSLRMTRKERVPLHEELSVIRSYLELQKIRHEERLIWELRVDRECEEVELPPMLLHQLVENAVKHGVEVRETVSVILLEACLREGKLFLRVTNPGTLDEARREGTGLLSIRNELESLYGEEASFTMRSTPGGAVIAEISLPVSS
jgi:integral membrane sensor domain MASE1